MSIKRNSIVFLCIVAVALGYVLYKQLVWNDYIVIYKYGSSSQLNEKLKAALIGDGKIELTEEDSNRLISSMIKDNVKFKGWVKEVNVSFLDDKILLSMIAERNNSYLYISTLLKPVMSEGSIFLEIDRTSVGKLNIPRFVVSYFLQKYLPPQYKAINGSSINLGNKISMFDIDNLYVYNDKLKIELKQDIPVVEAKYEDKNTSQKPADTEVKSNGTDIAQSPSNSQVDIKGSNESVAPARPKIDTKTAMLKKTNTELYGVLNSVKSGSAKNWVEGVISINSKMIENPGGNYADETNSAKDAYRKLPADVKSEIKNAAMDNLEMSAVKYLVSAYGL